MATVTVNVPIDDIDKIPDDCNIINQTDDYFVVEAPDDNNNGTADFLESASDADVILEPSFGTVGG